MGSPSATMLALCLALLLTAEEPPYVHDGLVYRSITVARYNPLGLSSFFRIGYRHPLLGAQQNIALQSTYVGLNAIATLSPAYARGGVRFDIQPLAFLNIVAAYEGIGYFGTFDALGSYTNVSQDFSDTAQDHHPSHPGGGQLFTVNPTLQLRYWRVTLVSSAEFVHTDLKVADPLYYDLIYSLLAPSHGWLVDSESDLLFAVNDAWQVGAHLGVTYAFYSPEAIAGDTQRANEIVPIVFTGPIVQHVFRRTNGPSLFKNATTFLMVAWWLRNPYRSGQEYPTALPYLMGGFAFEGEVPNTKISFRP